jgi:hypothetical protein
MGSPCPDQSAEHQIGGNDRLTKKGALAALDLNPTLSPAQFQGRFDLWLRQHEAEKPFGKLRELEARITEGNRRLSLAEKSGKTGTPDYERGVALLATLKAERDELRKTAQIPHFFMASVHNLLRASRGWGLPAGSIVRVEIPGVFDMAVDLAESELPF